MNELRLRHLTHLLLCLTAMLFLFYMGMLSFHVRPCSDDLWFFHSYTEHGWFRSLLHFEYNTRWTSYLMYNTICASAGSFRVLHQGIFVYYLVTFTLLLLALMRFIRLFSRHVLGLRLPAARLFVLGSFVMAALYFTTTHAMEVWFWTIASTAYVWPLVFLLTGAAEFFCGNSPRSRIAVFLAFFLLGGTVENMALAVFVCLLLFLLYTGRKRGFSVRALLAMTAVSILPLISFLEKGVRNRFVFEQQTLIPAGGQLFYDYPHVFNLPRMVLFGLLLICIGFLIQELRGKVLLNRKKILLTNLVILLVVAFTTYVPMLIIYHNLGPARASAPVNYAICGSLIFWVLLHAATAKARIKPAIALAGALMALFMLSYHSLNQARLTSDFARAYDQRVAWILQQKDNGSPVIFVPLLPDSGVLASKEVSHIDDPDYYSFASRYLGRVNGVEKLVFAED